MVKWRVLLLEKFKVRAREGKWNAVQRHCAKRHQRKRFR
jgi:hypothetical protein